jgi:hypothetical protein
MIDRLRLVFKFRVQEKTPCEEDTSEKRERERFRQHRTDAKVEETGQNASMDKQMTLSALTDELPQARTRKNSFWSRRKYHPVERVGGARQAVLLCGRARQQALRVETMRGYLLQELYDLADMAAMNEIIDSRAFSEFCGIDSSNQVPDGDTIGRFCVLLVRHDLQIFPGVKGYPTDGVENECSDRLRADVVHVQSPGWIRYSEQQQKCRGLFYPQRALCFCQTLGRVAAVVIHPPSAIGVIEKLGQRIGFTHGVGAPRFPEEV